jgi:N-acetyl-gamma-glutamyl-phosphate reductase
MKRFKASVIGGSGYGASEIIRRLLLHPDVELVRVASIDHVGENLAAAHPSLEGLTDLVFEDIPPEQAAAGMDVVLLGLPHKIAATMVPKIVGKGAKIIDLSGDFRLKDAASYARYYGAAHPCPELLPRAVYGLPELFRSTLVGAPAIAVPGCYPTSASLALAPLVRTSRVQPTGIIVDAASGVSGAGRPPKPNTTTLSPACTWAVFITAPMPVVTPQPM